ncbi:hypothetical protein BCR36DRAFT_183350 [Piromyces finnis]|uniref:Uncharacterized protein n=1 Tax=Piromyces finnis TaxID=1754191 RepID=A0A1Y1VFT8_9FUNG|nr:hypothetical protein BCR36DRAFT_183350 [Piromyces finnis]|eukprot:ORX55285.1 hypothetical protein BCR36DRAFT_183350 [Piromyces finnis]
MSSKINFFVNPFFFFFCNHSVFIYSKRNILFLNIIFYSTSIFEYSKANIKIAQIVLYRRIYYYFEFKINTSNTTPYSMSKELLISLIISFYANSQIHCINKWKKCFVLLPIFS